MPSKEIACKLGVKLGTINKIIYDYKHGNLNLLMSDEEK